MSTLSNRPRTRSPPSANANSRSTHAGTTTPGWSWDARNCRRAVLPASRRAASCSRETKPSLDHAALEHREQLGLAQRCAARLRAVGTPGPPCGAPRRRPSSGAASSARARPGRTCTRERARQVVVDGRVAEHERAHDRRSLGLRAPAGPWAAAIRSSGPAAVDRRRRGCRRTRRSGDRGPRRRTARPAGPARPRIRTRGSGSARPGRGSSRRRTAGAPPGGARRPRAGPHPRARPGGPGAPAGSVPGSGRQPGPGGTRPGTRGPWPCGPSSRGPRPRPGSGSAVAGSSPASISVAR